MDDKKVIRLVSSRVQASEPADDVVAMLRLMADRIESGEFGDVDNGLFTFYNSQDEIIEAFAWGSRINNAADANLLLDKCKARLVEEG